MFVTVITYVTMYLRRHKKRTTLSQLISPKYRNCCEKTVS